MRGIRFNIPDEYNKSFEQILLNVDIENYTWDILQSDIYLKLDYSHEELLFPEKRYNNADFIRLISNEPYYIIFANIQARYKDSEYVDIGDYDDFLNSNCEIAILIVDSIFVDIYCKNQDIIEVIKRNAEINDFKNIEYITDGNDRMTFSAM